MKRTILMMMLAAVAMCGWAAGNGNKTLKVKLDIFDFGDTAVIYRSGKEEKTFIGKNGKFEFEFEVDTIGEGYLVQPRLLRGDMESPRFYSLPLVPGEEMRLWDTDGTRYDVDGTGFYAEYHKVDLFNENAVKESSGYGRQFREMRENGTVSEEELTKFYNDIYEPSFDRYQEALFDYIKAHPKQEAAVWLLKSINGLDKKKEAYALFDVSVREGRMKSLYDSWIAAAEENERAEAEEKEAQKKQVAGIEAPVFTLNDINGKPLALTSLRGKYVILDFWGSWCVWCIKGFPKMKEYYAKYPGKFEILGIDCNDTEEKWKAAVKQHELPWLHVYCPKESTVLADYGITGFPTKIVIGPDGKIVRTIVGEDPAFYTLLDELFGQ
jgi:thiol-disulfide isomerase/thioredoxin